MIMLLNLLLNSKTMQTHARLCKVENIAKMLYILVRTSSVGVGSKLPSYTSLTLKHDRLEIRMPDSTSDSRKPSDRFDTFETKIVNRETFRKTGLTVSSVVYKAADVDRRYNH